MKKIFNMMMAVAIATFTFTACEDVPEPYNNPYDNKTDGNGTEVVIIPTGDGTIDNPYNVAAAQKLIESLGADVNSEVIYVKGIISDLGAGVSTDYWNAQFNIADDAKGTNQLLVYRSNYLENKLFTSTDQIKEGDEVIVCGSVVNYKGNTPEFTTGTYIYSINGKTTEGGNDETVETVGTKDAPKTIAEALAAINALEDNAISKEFWFVKGKVVKVTTSQENFDKYGNLNYLISEDGSENNTITVYSGDGLNGEKFSGIDALKAGDEVVVYGNIQKFINKTSGAMTPEIAKGNYLVKYTAAEGGSGNEEPDEPVTGDNLLSNGDFETWAGGLPVNWKSTTTASNATLSQSSDAHAGNYAVKVAHDANGNKRISYKEITLKAGTYTGSFYVKAADAAGASVNPGYVNVGTDGKVGTYNYDGYVNGITTTWQQVTFSFTLATQSTINLLVMVPKNSGTDAIIDDFTLSTNNGGLVDDGGDDTPSTPTDEVKPVTVAEFNTAAESNDIWYQLTGTISNLKDADLYGNFDLTDETGSVYVYGVLSEKGGDKKLFQDLVSKYGIKNGSTITIIGNRGSYNGKIEVMNAYFVDAK